MSTQANKEFYQGAMYNGTILGVIWSIMYLLLFAGTTSMLSLFLCMTLYMSSPFIATRFAIRYRRDNHNNTMSFMQAWSFVLYMYLCATLLSTLVTYIYFAFFDGGTFFTTLQSMLDESLKIPNTDTALTQQIEQIKEIIDKTTTNDFVWQIMNNNLTNTTLLPMIIAVFVKRKEK